MLLDLNGTLTTWGKIDLELPPRLAEISRQLSVHLLSADTYGTLGRFAAELGVSAEVVSDGEAKLAVLQELGASRCVALGNGANDAKMIEAAALGISVIGGEGLSASALTWSVARR